MSGIAIKRAYDAPSPQDGVRVLVDRIWPRGLKRDAADIDLWLKDVAPQTGLRKWFGHDPEKWAEFVRRYRTELDDNDGLAQLLEMARARKITLVFAARDVAHNNAIVLKELCEETLKKEA